MPPVVFSGGRCRCCSRLGALAGAAGRVPGGGVSGFGPTHISCPVCARPRVSPQVASSDPRRGVRHVCWSGLLGRVSDPDRPTPGCSGAGMTTSAGPGGRDGELRRDRSNQVGSRRPNGTEPSPFSRRDPTWLSEKDNQQGTGCQRGLDLAPTVAPTGHTVVPADAGPARVPLQARQTPTARVRGVVRSAGHTASRLTIQLPVRTT